MDLYSSELDYKPIDRPEWASRIYAVLGCAPSRDALCAVYLATDGPVEVNQVVVLDYDVSPLEGLAQFVRRLGERIHALADEHTIRRTLTFRPHCIAFVEGGGIGQSLRQAIEKIGAVEILEIPQPLAALDIQELAAAATMYAARSLVKFTKFAYERRMPFDGELRNHLLDQITRFNIREPPAAIELFRAWCLGILIALEDPPRERSAP